MSREQRIARTLAILSTLKATEPSRRIKALWVGCDGHLRIGRTGDMIAMMERLGKPSAAN